ncbi:hypothetical protein AB4072_02415 [Microvirga sp. 2MCAF38]|uniref:hypothetical protein n=1 Tax=Microvirga sp. 2MCAF38 TaxID=3232989 RepID=UPI003F98A0D3
MAGPDSDIEWRADIDSLSFRPGGHEGICVVHRLAFRTLLGLMPTPQQCETFFLAERKRFEAAAREKLVRRALARSANFHLSSRDILRAAIPATHL